MEAIYQFTSASTALGAFTRDRTAKNLPEKYGPWNFVAAIDSYQRFPFGFPRKTVEGEIASRGYQLWRMKPETAAQPGSAPVEAAKTAG